MTLVRPLWWILCVAWLSACGCGPDEPIDANSPYARLVGAEYRVVADDLNAYGIYSPLDDKYNNKPIRYIVLIPGVGIGGSEVAWSRHVPKGQTVKILSALHNPGDWVENSTYFLVALDGVDLPHNVPIKLQLRRGNEGTGAELNPKVYSKVTADR